MRAIKFSRVKHIFVMSTEYQIEITVKYSKSKKRNIPHDI